MGKIAGAPQSEKTPLSIRGRKGGDEKHRSALLAIGGGLREGNPLVRGEKIFLAPRASARLAEYNATTQISVR